jgi:hypothetical protein
MSCSGWHEASDEEKDALGRGLDEVRKKLARLREELARAAIKGGRSGALMREAIAVLRRDPPVQWETVDGYEQMEFFEWVADALEHAYFSTPAKTKARRLARKRNERKGYRDLIDIVASREGISEAKALAKVAEEFNKTPEALRKFLQRDRNKTETAPDPGWREK